MSDTKQKWSRMYISRNFQGFWSSRNYLRNINKVLKGFFNKFLKWFLELQNPWKISRNVHSGPLLLGIAQKTLYLLMFLHMCSPQKRKSLCFPCVFATPKTFKNHYKQCISLWHTENHYIYCVLKPCPKCTFLGIFNNFLHNS